MHLFPKLLLTATLLNNLSWAAIPDGPGKTELLKVCGACHSVELAASHRQDRTGWEDTIGKMAAMGATGTEAELEAVISYLTTNFGPEAPKPLNVNQATAVELESMLALTRRESAAFIQYRTDHGDFKSFDDLKKVPNVDMKKLEARKDRLVF